MRYQITAWEEFGTLERRHYRNDKGQHFTLDIRWADSLFIVDEDICSTDETRKNGLLLNDLPGFDLEFTYDGQITIVFDDNAFSDKEKDEITEVWTESDDEGLRNIGYDEDDVEYFIFGEVKSHEIDDED
jgi:hypothetical protein